MLKEISYPHNQTKFVAEKLLSMPDVKTVLNIGYRHDSDHTLRNVLVSNGIQFSVLEVFKPNCDFMERAKISNDIINMNVKDIESLGRKFDAVIWLHGPEHVSWEEFLSVRTSIENCADKIVIYQAPTGECPQDELYSNPFERHVSTLYPEPFEQLGYKTINHDKGGKYLSFSAYIEK